jgi:hypothetical protein
MPTLPDHLTTATQRLGWARRNDLKASHYLEITDYNFCFIRQLYFSIRHAKTQRVPGILATRR